jgi:hypothetical protein
MPESELAVVSIDSFQAPALIARAGPTIRKKFFEFFTVPIRNANTRAAYYRAIQQFLAWAERAGYQDIEDIEPITVALISKPYGARRSRQRRPGESAAPGRMQTGFRRESAWLAAGTDPDSTTS